MPVKSFLKIQILLLPAMLCVPVTSHAGPVKTPPVRTGPIRSVFIMPASPKEGRDPFFPDSTRIYETGVVATVSHVPEITSLKIKGYSVVNGQPMIIINNHSFMVNDEGDVLTSGGRVHIRCLEIKASTAIIEANGQRLDLHF
jgi:hypothetical protein